MGNSLNIAFNMSLDFKAGARLCIATFNCPRFEHWQQVHIQKDSFKHNYTVSLQDGKLTER